MNIKKVYDLTQPLYHNCPGWPDFPPPTVERMLFIPRDICNVERIEINTHTGTHIDVPYHFVHDGVTLDKVPVETWVGEGIVVDVSYKKDKEAITPDDLEKQAAHVKKDDIVMLYTGRGKHRGFNETYLKNWPSVGQEGAQWLVDKGARIIGIDGLGIEMYGFSEPVVHRTILGAGVLVIEELYLEDIVSMGKKRWLFVCLPLLLKDAGGCLARVIAMDVE
ncbi:MAG: cyclase family protein [Spirochaetes bacterium]|nr:cyclase family protein [Spirochaetota bacterium]